MPSVGRKAKGKHTQSVIFATDAGWTKAGSRKWVADHDLFTDGLDETPSSFRWRQYDPEPNNFRYRNKVVERKDDKPSVTLVLGFPKNKQGAPRMKEVLAARFQLDDAATEAGTFKGLAAVFDTAIDTFLPSIIKRGAFKKTLRENKSRVRILWQHEDSEPIGLPTTLSETDTGLEVEGKISDTTRGRDALTLMRDGVVTDLSIGFDPIRVELDRSPDPDLLKSLGFAPDQIARASSEGLRVIREIRLWEFSPVTWGANEPAKIQEVNRALRGDPQTDQAHVLDDEELIERYLSKLNDADLAERLRLVLGPTLTLSVRNGEDIDEEGRELVRQSIHSLQAFLAAAEPPRPAALTVRLEALRRAELTWAEHIQKWAA